MKNLNIFLFIILFTTQTIRSNEVEIDKLAKILLEIETKFFPKNIRLDIVDSPKNICRANINSITVSRNFLKSMKYFENNEIKAVMCHEVSHILSHDLAYKNKKENYSFDIDMDLRLKYNSFWLDKKGKRVEELNHKTEESNLTSYDIDNKIDINKDFYFSIETEKNADILAWDCLTKLDVSNPKEVLKGMLRTIRTYMLDANQQQVKDRLKNIKEISCE